MNGNFLYVSKKNQSGPLYQPREVGWVGREERGSKVKRYIPMADSY